MALRRVLTVSRQLLTASDNVVQRSSIPHSGTSGLLKSDKQQACWLQCTLRRTFATLDEVQGQVDEVNDLFVEARELIEDARDEAETVYFNDAHKDAKDAVEDVLQKYNAVLDGLSEDDRGKLQRSMGLKIGQLKAELGELDALHA